jgi:hypothetical protein
MSMAKKAPAPAKPSDSGTNTAGPSGSNPPSETMGGRVRAFRAKSFGVSPGAPPHSNPAAAKAEAMTPVLRDDSPGPVPEGTSQIIVSPSDAQEESAAPTAQQNPAENKEV